MDMLKTAKLLADKIEAEASKSKLPVTVCVIDIHGNVVLKHRMTEAPTFSLDLAEAKAYTSALVKMRTANILPLAQPGQPRFPRIMVSQRRYCAIGGGVPLSDNGQVVAGVGVSGGTTDQDIAIVEAAFTAFERDFDLEAPEETAMQYKSGTSSVG